MFTYSRTPAHFERCPVLFGLVLHFVMRQRRRTQESLRFLRSLSTLRRSVARFLTPCIDRKLRNMDTPPAQQAHDQEQDPGAEAREVRNRVVTAIQSLLDRHGVPERKRLVSLEAALGIEYNQIRRRMKGDTPWSVGEIAQLAAHFGEPVLSLVGAFIDEPGQPATLQMAGVALPCSIWPGCAASSDTGFGPLVAVRSEGSEHWIVMLSADAGERTAYEVRRLSWEAPLRRRVAVVDDDETMTAAIVQFLRQKGLDALSYRTEEHVRTALETSPFDGFILDWVLEQGNVKDLLPAIRSKNPNGPIIILTGQIETGAAQEDELAASIASYRAQLYEKPTRMLSLFNALELGFESMTRPVL